MTLRPLLARTLNRLRHPSPFMVIGVLLVVSASFMLAQSAKAGGLGLFDFDSVTIFIGQILLTLVGLIGNLLLAAITQLLAVAAYNDFGGASAVVKGWVIVRDLANMTFIVFLLIISFGTILRIEQYRYNQLLGKLLLMAVLINFSKLITLFFIDGAQVVMLTFVSAFKDAAAGNLTTAFGLSDSLKFLANDTSVADVSARSILVTVLLALALYIIALIVIVVILVVLVIRIFALWVLIILSPMAYALRAFPNTRSQSSKWWSEFGKYVTTGPIIAFFLWLALSVMASGSLTKGFEMVKVTNKSQIPGAESTTQLTAALSDISSTEKLLSFMLAIAFLLMGLSTAQGLGGAAGKIAGDWADKIKKGGLKAASAPFAPLKLAGWGAKKLGKKVQTDLAESGTFFGKKVPIPKRIYGGRLPFITKEFWEGVKERGDDRRKDAMIRVKGMGKRSADVASQFAATRNWKKARHMAGEYDIDAQTALIESKISDQRKSLGKAADNEENIVKTSIDVEELGGADGNTTRQATLLRSAGVGHSEDIFTQLSWRIHKKLEAELGVDHGLKVTKSQVWDDKQGKFFEKLEIPKSVENYQRFALRYLHMNPDKFTTGDNAARLKAAEGATSEEKDNLRVLSNMSYATIEGGHPEQFYGLRDENTGTDYIPTITGAVIKQVAQMSKKSNNDNLLHMTPNMGVMKMVSEETDAQGRHTDRNSVRTEDLDPMQHGLMGNQLTKAITTETRRIAVRNPDQMLGRFVDDNGVLISDNDGANRKGFEDAADLQRQFKSYMAIAPDGLEAMGKQRFNGGGAVGEFPNRSGFIQESGPTQKVSSQYNYPDFKRQADAAGYDGVQQGELLSIADVLGRPEFAPAFGQFTQSQIDKRSIRTGQGAEEVKQNLQSEAESALRNALKNVVPELKKPGDLEYKGAAIKQEFIESLVTHGKNLTPEIFEDVPSPTLHVAGESYPLPPQLIGTPEVKEAGTNADKMKNFLDSLNVDEFGNRLDTLTRDLERNFTELSSAFHRGAGRVGNPKLAEPIDSAIGKLRDELSRAKSEGRLDQKEGQRQNLENLRRFYRSLGVSLAHGSPSTKEKDEEKGKKK